MVLRFALIGLLFVTGCTVEESNVINDETEIRALFDNWIRATTEGDLALAKSCISDDARFFVPGVGEMNKDEFAEAAAGGDPSESPYIFDLDSKLEEVVMNDNHAYMVIQSTLVMTPKSGDAPTTMAGYSLSMLERVDGKWRITRDANTLTVQE